MRFSPITSMFAIDSEWMEKRGEVPILVKAIDGALAGDIRSSFPEAPILEEEQIRSRSNKNPWYEYRDNLTVLCRVQDEIPDGVEVVEQPRLKPAAEQPPLFPPIEGEPSSNGGEMTEVELGQVLSIILQQQATILQQNTSIQNQIDAIVNAQGMILARAYGIMVPQPSDDFFEQFHIKITRKEASKIVTQDPRIVIAQ